MKGGDNGPSRSQPHDQFPQPTRPTCSYDHTNPDTQLPENTLPQSSRPIYSYNTFFESSAPKHIVPQHLHTSGMCIESIDPCISSEETHITPSTPAKTPKEEVEAVDQLVQILIQCLGVLNTKNRELMLRKFFSEIEKESCLEEFILERLKSSKVGLIAELLEKIPERLGGADESNVPNSVKRDIDLDTVEEYSQKLERFKVKTLDLGGVVKEEKEENK